MENIIYESLFKKGDSKPPLRFNQNEILLKLMSATMSCLKKNCTCP